MRRKTIHDRVVVKEEGLECHLLYDWYKRGSLLDHFIESGVDLASFMRSEYYEAGDFVLGAYDLKQRKAGWGCSACRWSATETLPASLSGSEKRSSLRTGRVGIYCAL